MKLRPNNLRNPKGEGGLILPQVRHSQVVKAYNEDGLKQNCQKIDFSSQFSVIVFSVYYVWCLDILPRFAILSKIKGGSIISDRIYKHLFWFLWNSFALNWYKPEFQMLEPFDNVSHIMGIWRGNSSERLISMEVHFFPLNV